MRQIFHQFLKLESTSAIFLLLMALIGMVWANTPWAYLHQQFIDISLFWINEVLMSLFFLLVGLELKRGYIDGELSQFSAILLPFIAALGGMFIPAIVYLSVNATTPETWIGWATPVATDIAFALGVLSLFGRRLPASLKLFLLTLAIFDDLGAIIIIAVGYSHGLVWGWLLFTASMMFILILLNRLSIQVWWLYLFFGIGLWVGLFYAGIHPTLSGVLLALTLPDRISHDASLLRKTENRLHPWVAYFIMPLFALANAGVSLKGLSLSIFADTVVLGVIASLFFGKQIGVFSFAWLAIRLGWARLPHHVSWLMLYGVSILCGIGFTMSLFLGTLSFLHQDLYLIEIRLGVIIGSTLSGLVGAIILYFALTPKKRSNRIDSRK